MAEEIVKVIKIETGSSERSINSLKADIKSLTKELNSLTIGSERYNKVQADLVNKTTQLKEINSSMRIQTRTLQQDLNALHKFTVGLTSGFTALTGALTLVGADSEDFNKTIQKLLASLTVLNSLSGLRNLIGSFSSVKDSVVRVGDSIKSFFSNAVNSFDPLERRLTQAANNLSGIGNIDIKADIKTSGAGNQIVATNRALAEQSKTIVPLNKQYSEYAESLRTQRSRLQELVSAKKLDQEAIVKQILKEKELIAVVKELNQIEEIAAKNYEKSRSYQKNKNLDLDVLPVSRLQAAARATGKDYDALIEKFKKLSAEGAKSYNEAAQPLKNLQDNLENTKSEYEKLQTEIRNTEKELNETEKAIGKTSNALKFFKNVASTVGWTVLISFLVTAVYKLIDYVKELNKATKAQKLFNQEVNKTTAEISSSTITKFIELQKAYKAVGDTAEDKSQFLKDYADALKETGLKITDAQTAEDAFINNTEKYKQAIIARAKIDAYREQITKKTKEYIENMLELDRQLESGEFKNLTATQRSQLAGISQTGSQYGPSLPSEQQIAQRNEAIIQFQQENLQKIQEQRETYESEYNKFVSDILNKQTDLEKRYSGLWTDTVKAASTQTIKEVKENLPDIDAILQPIMDEIDRFIEAEADVLLGDKDKELRDLENNWFKPYLELYKEYGGDVESLLEEYERRKKAIIDKYSKPDIDYTAELTKIKELYDFQVGQLSNYKPKTDYKQFGYTFQYQSGKDVDAEYENTVAYNNQIYDLTAERINKENELYNNQLANSQLTADEKLKIQQKLAENEKALQDAADKRDDDNTAAAIDRQKKKLQAFQATAQVTSSILGSLGSIYDTKAQTATSEKEMKKASKTAKGFKAAQAVIDALSAANGAYSSMASIPYVGPGLGAAAAAAALIAGYANVKSILAQDITGSSVQNVTANVPSASTPNISYTKELLGDKELDVVNQPIKCYVVESEITNTQNKVRTQVTNSTF